MKYKIENLTGMRLRYKNIKFEPKETKILELDSIQEHEYFNIEKLEKTKKSNIHEELEKSEKKTNKTQKEVK